MASEQPTSKDECEHGNEPADCPECNPIFQEAVVPGFHSVTVTGDKAGQIVTTIDMIPKIRITAHVARRLLREVVTDTGRDHTVAVPGRYVHDDRPMCIVARALYRLGVTVDELADMDLCSSLNDIRDVRLPARVRMSVQARIVLGAAQGVQDVQDTWGDALDAALAVRPLRQLRAVTA
jgi:hypothetical protein